MKKILYIEDEEDQVVTVQALLEYKGYKVISAMSGEQGLKLAKEENPDLILLDIFLPGMNGLEVCSRLKQMPETKDIPVVVLTACGVGYLEEQCKDIGALACIRKPYETIDLVAKIKVALGEV